MPTEGDRVLVTGGAGFIGSRLVRLLAASGTPVCAFDSLASGLPIPEATGTTSVIGDIRDERALDAALAAFRPTVVVHLAAVHHIPTCEVERAYSLDVNVIGTERVLAAAERHGVTHVVHASSGAVYDTVDGPLHEASTAVVPHDNYALAKVTNERQATFWAARIGGSVTLARIFNTIGPGDPNAHLLPDIVVQVRDGVSDVVRLGNTSPQRDYVWVEDVAGALAAAVRRPGVAAEVQTINICSGQEHSVVEIVQEIGALLGRSLTIEVDEARVRRIDRAHQLGDPSVAAERLGWRVTTPLRDALAVILRSDGLLPTK